MSSYDPDLTIEAELAAVREKLNELTSHVWMTCRRIRQGVAQDPQKWKAQVLLELGELESQIVSRKRKSV